eukprot:g33287.t1
MPFCPLLLPFCPSVDLFPFYALVRTHVARQVPPGCSTSHSAARRATRLLVEPLSCSSSHSAARRATQLLVEPLSCSTGLKTFWRAVPPEPLCQNRDMSAVTLHYTILVTYRTHSAVRNFQAGAEKFAWRGGEAAMQYVTTGDTIETQGSFLRGHGTIMRGDRLVATVSGR